MSFSGCDGANVSSDRPGLCPRSLVLLLLAILSLNQWGKGRDTPNTETSCAYITVGTGIGVGLVVNGRTVHGLLHPEAGHLCLRQLESDKFPGVDDLFGGSSVEGLASTIALASRKVSSTWEFRPAYITESYS